MQKRGLIILILIASINFVSAQVGIGEFLDAFGGENLLLLGSFIISFVLINFILGRLPVFKSKSKVYPFEVKRNKAVPGVIAFIISLFIVYGINKLDFDLANFFSSFGIGQGTLELIAIIAVLAGLIFLFWKFKRLVFLVLGLLLIGVSFTELIYEKGIVLIAGIALIVLWGIIKIVKRKKRETRTEYIRTEYLTDRNRQSQINNERREQERRKEQQEAIRSEQEELQQRETERQRRGQEEARRKEAQRQRTEYEKLPEIKAELVKEKQRRPKITRRDANFYLSFRDKENLIVKSGESEKRFRIGNKGGGRIKWNAHARPLNFIQIHPNKGVFGPNQIIDASIRINRSIIPPGTRFPIIGAIGIHTLDRKRNKATFSARISVY